MPRPRARYCRNFSGVVSSARFIVRACKDCGRKTMKKRCTALRSPGECPRDLCDTRGSVPDTVRVHCYRCLTYIDDQTRKLAQDKKATAEKLERSSIIHAEAIDNLIGDDRPHHLCRANGCTKGFH
eukprot:7033745-Pyramimonas_sp.AAC.1